MSELSERGLAIYESKLKALLKPEQNNKFVAIHVNTEDYVVARTSGDAMRAMRQRHADGPLVIMKIGPEPEYGLTARVLASDMIAAARFCWNRSEMARRRKLCTIFHKKPLLS